MRVLFIFMIVFLLLESCMRMRTNDKEAKRIFSAKNLEIEINILKIDHKKLHYVKIGKDTLPVLFFIHGSPGSWNAFEQYLMDTDLLKKFKMIAIDRPGFGYSNFGYAMNLPNQCVLIEKIIEKERKNKNFHLVGHSIGGPIVVQLAQNNPNFYASLSILAGSISPIHEPKENWRYLFKYFPTRYILPGALRPSNDEILYFKKDLYNLDKNYQNLNMPITFIHGDKDNLVPFQNVEYGLKKLAQNKQVNCITIKGANHFIPWEHYETIKKHLMQLD